MQRKSVSRLFLFILFSVSSSPADDIFKKDSIKRLADSVREYRNKNIKRNHRHNWVYGTYYTGLMAMYESTSDEAYLNQCMNYGESVDWAIPDKTKAGWDSTFYSFVSGQIWYGCYQEKKDEALLAPTFTFLNDPDKSTPITAPSEWYLENCGIRFVDGLYFSPPLFAMLYQHTGEEQFVEWMDTCYWDTSDELYDEERTSHGPTKKAKMAQWMNPRIMKGHTSRKTTRSMGKVFWSRSSAGLAGWSEFSATFLRIIPVTRDTRHNICRWPKPSTPVSKPMDSGEPILQTRWNTT